MESETKSPSTHILLLYYVHFNLGNSRGIKHLNGDPLGYLSQSNLSLHVLDGYHNCRLHYCSYLSSIDYVRSLADHLGAPVIFR
jgi:hypothetical protein